LTARTDAAAEAAEVAAAEAAAAEAAVAVEAAAAAEATAAAGGRRESRRRCAWRASGLGALAAERAWRRRGRHGRGRQGHSRVARVLCGGPSGIKNSRRVAQQQGANTAVQAERSTPIKVLRSLEYNNALILNAIITVNFIIGVHLHVKR
jgi:hypothetical protein